MEGSTTEKMTIMYKLDEYSLHSNMKGLGIKWNNFGNWLSYVARGSSIGGITK